MKKRISLLLIIISVIVLSGCSIKRDTLEDIDIYTTVYPIEYITNRLYGTHSNIYSIYPAGVNPDTYTLTNKQILDYSNTSMFIFSGLDKDKDYVIPMLKYNENIKIIDTTLSMSYIYGKEELWLDPSNFLMLAQNIRNGFKEYINNYYLKSEIDKKYEELKVEISNIDANMRLMAASSTNKTIVVSNDLYKFLGKYNINVISLQETDMLNEKTIANVAAMIKNGTISYIFMKQNEDVNNTIKKLVANTKVQLITLNSISNLTEEEITAKKDYINIMTDNIDLLKNELYD